MGQTAHPPRDAGPFLAQARWAYLVYQDRSSEARSLKPTVSAVIGAGPYGLAVAAHLQARGILTLVFGKPMEFWRRMPRDLNLKSTWSAASLSDPRGLFSLDRYVRSVEPHPGEPIPLPFFLRYADWFVQRAVPTVDETLVRRLTRMGDRFRLELADGRTIDADRVVIASGIHSFAHIPEFARELDRSVCGHTSDHSDFSAFRGRRVAVVGSGQSALEYAALLHEAGAHVEVITRGPVIWISRKLYDRTGPARRIFYPPTDVGPPGINWLVAFPLIMRHFPERLRSALHRRAVRPSGAKWLRPRVVGRVKITQVAEIRRVRAHRGAVRIELGDGTERQVDYLMLGTGFRPSLDAIAFLDPQVRDHVEERSGSPVLNTWFESSMPRLHFAGSVAGYNFGPLCNFMVGAGTAAKQIATRAERDQGIRVMA